MGAAGLGVAEMSAPAMSGRGGWKPRRLGRRAPLPGAAGDQYGFYFDPSRHDFSDQVFLGRSYSGGAGIAAGEHALDVLARAPATARHLSYQLAQYFVADNPPPGLVGRMAERFEQSQGDIRATLEMLFFSPEFWDQRYFGAKFKTPYDYVISAVRVTGAPEITNYRPLFGTLTLLGMAPYAHETPDGYANTREAWLNPDAMMTRLSFATALGQGHLPLLAPPFEAGGGGAPFRVKFKGGGGAPFRVKFKGGGGAAMRELDSQRAKGFQMDPPEPAQLDASLGGNLSANTREAIESAPAQLRSALILGSPEFMVR
jgi:hypothetical protein